MLSVRKFPFLEMTSIKTLIKVVSLGVLFVFPDGYGQQEQLVPDNFQREGMTSVVNTVTIAGAPEAVFDLITTARFWPEWHPASLAVGGVTERPYGLGDQIHERGRIGDRNFQITWKVVEHVHPSRVVLQSERSPTRITYSFQASSGATVFTRELRYKGEDLAAVAPTPGEVEQLMRTESEQAINRLKKLVEKILYKEAMGMP
jgi:uncharacterized protein YndB with AHSA1/START domain